MKTEPQGGHQSYDRLKTLYGISKLLSRFESIEVTFPKILDLTADSFPLFTVVLIENWGSKPKTAVWRSVKALPDQVASALQHAVESYSYLIGGKIEDALEFIHNKTSPQETKNSQSQNYIVLPLIINDLPPHGILQIQGYIALSEKDLDFVNALTDLIGVALDRFYKTKKENEQREHASAADSVRITDVQNKVVNLETERELRESFVSLLTHDLRTPLSAVLMASQLIQRKPESTEVIKTLASRIERSVNQAGLMITNLLDANLIRSGEKLQLKIEKIDLTELMTESLDILRTIHGERFVLNCPPTLLGFWDRIGLRRVIENLCNNAVKYGFTHTPIEISIQTSSEGIELSVHNQGNAISDDEQQCLFDQFRRTKSAHASNKKGWGIGLTLVKGVVEAHGGCVRLKSLPEIGTTFSVHIPTDSRPSYNGTAT